MGSKNNPLGRFGWLADDNAMDKIAMASVTMLVGVIFLGVVLPIFVSQIAGWSSISALSGWANLGALQTVLYAIPVFFGIGMIIVVVRFFSRSRE